MKRNRFLTIRDYLIPMIIMGDPFAYRRTVESEDQINNRDARDPNQAPKPGKGDSYILAATILGIVLGGVAGFFIAFYGFGISMVFLGVIGGIFVGGIVGVFAGSWLKQKKQKQSERDEHNAGL